MKFLFQIRVQGKVKNKFDAVGERLKFGILRFVTCCAFIVLAHNACLAELVEYEIPKTGSFLPIRAECNGKEFYCTLDTGSFETAINDKSKYLHGVVIKENEKPRR